MVLASGVDKAVEAVRSFPIGNTALRQMLIQSLNSIRQFVMKNQNFSLELAKKIAILLEAFADIAMAHIQDPSVNRSAFEKLPCLCLVSASLLLSSHKEFAEAIEYLGRATVIANGLDQTAEYESISASYECDIIFMTHFQLLQHC